MPFVCVCSSFAILGFVLSSDLITDGLRRGGLFTSDFSCVLFAELAVGRIMRARKLSSGALVGRGSGFLAAAEGGRAREVRGVGFVLVVEGLGAVRVAGAGRDDGWAGLGTVDEDSFLAADEAVGAVR